MAGSSSHERGHEQGGTWTPDEVNALLDEQYQIHHEGIGGMSSVPEPPAIFKSPRSKFRSRRSGSQREASQSRAESPQDGREVYPELDRPQSIVNSSSHRSAPKSRSWALTSSDEADESDVGPDEEAMSSEAERDETVLDESMPAHQSSRIIEAMLLTAPTAPLRTMPLPWENNTWLQSLLTGSPIVPMPRLPTPVPYDHRLTPEEPKYEQVRAPRTLGAGPRKAPREWEEEKSKSRQAALQLWVNFIRGYEEFSALGRYLSRAEDSDKMCILKDTFEGKATSTIRGRGYSMLQYSRWAESCAVRVFPITESKVYEFFKFSRGLGVSATRLTRFREALAFSLHTIGLDLNAEVLQSRRVAGAALSLKKTKRARVQRPPLTVAHVLWLEGYVCSATAGFDCVFAGFLLFMLHCRCRFSDAMHVDSEPRIDGPWVESETSEFKTKNSKGRKDMVLPLVGCSEGLSMRPWAQKWLEARKALGLCAGPRKPFMPVMLGTGVWTNAALSNHEANELIRELFSKAPFPLPGVGTHSFKGTILSWIAKANVPQESRKLLGGHVIQGDVTMHTYGRDALSGPLREMEAVLIDIFEDRFRPDVSRSGMYVKKQRSLPERSPAEQTLKERSPSSSEESYSDSSSSSSGSDPGNEKVAILLHPRDESKAQVEPPEPVWQHRTRFTFHRLPAKGTGAFACGRAVSTAFLECAVLPKVLTPRCAVCFAGAAYAFF